MSCCPKWSWSCGLVHKWKEETSGSLTDKLVAQQWSGGCSGLLWQRESLPHTVGSEEWNCGHKQQKWGSSAGCLDSVWWENNVQRGQSVGSPRAASDYTFTCRELLLSERVVSRICGTSGLCATLVCAVVGPSGSHRKEWRHNIQRVEVQLREGACGFLFYLFFTVSILQHLCFSYSVFIFYSLDFFTLPFPATSAVVPVPVLTRLSTSRHSAATQWAC